MSSHTEVQPEKLAINPFQAIGKDWMLIAAAKGGKTNAMTASWGGLGVMWGKNVSFIVIRPQRFTREFVDASDYYSLNFFGGERRDMLNYFGTVSGRDEDKAAKTGLTVEQGDAPYFAEASTVFLCRKLFCQPYQPESFLLPDLDKTFYPSKDYHALYIGEVVRVLTK